MLEDTERKLMRILYNYFAQNRYMPGWVEVTKKVGRDKEQVTQILNGLTEKGYLEWNRLDTITIRLLQSPESPQPMTHSSGTDYFTEY